MRVTTTMLFNTTQTQLQKQTARLFEAHEEAASGKRVRRPSDDPVSTRRILNLRRTLESVDQFKQNAARLRSLLQLTEGTVGDAGNLLVRAKELALAGANATATVETRTIMAQEVAQLFAQAVQIGNAELGGRHLFAGRANDQTPFSALVVTESTASGLTTSGTITTLSAGDVTINGTSIRAGLAGDDTLSTSDNAASAIAIAAAINDATAMTGVLADASTTLSLTVTAFGNLDAGEFTINGQNVTGTITDAASLVAAVNAANVPGVFASSTGTNNLTLTAADGRNIRLQTSGGVGGLDFTEFALSGGALDQTTSGTVRLSSDTTFSIAGTNPANAGLTAGTVDRIVGGRFTGDSGQIDIAISAEQRIKANIVGTQFLVADLRPDIDQNTPLASLRLGKGISAGSIKITDRVGTTATIDLSTATTVEDVISAINAASVNVAAAINTAGNGLVLTDTNATPTGNLKVEEVGSGTTASELGIVADRPGSIVGFTLQSLLTETTPLGLLYEGQGVTLTSLHIANGSTEADVDLSTAQTIRDVITAINASGTNVTARLNVARTALEVRSNDAATVAIITEVGNGTTAADLGIQGPQDILKTLSLLQEALEKNDLEAIDQLLIHIDTGVDRTLEIRTEVGARLNRVELVENNLEDFQLMVTTRLSETEDADALEVFSRLANLEVALQATLASTARMVQTTLLDFLR